MRLPRGFDNALMMPPAQRGVVDGALLASLRAWCEGSDVDAPNKPLRVASIAPHDGLDGVACALDGSHALARLGRWRGLSWRLQILWRECVTMRGPSARDPWDCGWWRPGSLGPAEAFRPRRATLLMVRECDAAAAAALLAALHANSPAFTQPVRVVVVSASAIAGIERR
ncbi:hypothetical protein ACQ859_20465 [Roseateles chitinivorans]|uniref:hypothetical protein n=1 Tax=Roseateles chitinivorans TaxID=2917965 RepID=UPI003D66660D